MRIDGRLSRSQHVHPDRIQRSGASIHQGRLISIGTTSQDKAHLSVDAQTLDWFKAAISQTPEIRQERVEALRHAIWGGRYLVTDRQLADAIHSELAKSSSA